MISTEESFDDIISSGLEDTDICSQQTTASAEGEDQSSKNERKTSTGLQLEQLANTNLLTVRIKWQLPEENGHYKSRITDQILDAIQHYKGISVNSADTEAYEFLPETKRSQILEQNKDIYLFEHGTEEYGKSYEDSEKENNWKYDTVLQAQFKYPKSLQNACADTSEILKSEANRQYIDRWSIGVNKHALTYPGNIFVGGIAKSLSIGELSFLFSKYGPILSMKLIYDRTKGEPNGYGFFSYALGSQASLCIKELNGKTVNGSTLFINYHVERKERERIHWDHVKENNNDDNFRCLFIGNLPYHNPDKEEALITPKEVIDVIKKELSKKFPDFDIISYYFPRRSNTRSSSSVSFNDEGSIDPNKISSTTIGAAQDEDVLKGYGFIKLINHEQALAAIETFNGFMWHGNRLVVNKAVQHKVYNNHNNHDKQSSIISHNDMEALEFANNPMYDYNNYTYDRYYFNNNKNENNNDTTNVRYFDSVRSTPVTEKMDLFYPQRESFSEGRGQRVPRFVGNKYDMYQYPSTSYSLPIPMSNQQESNLYVKHIPLSWTDEDLYGFYKTFGEIISVKVITVGGSKNKYRQQSNDSSSDSELPVGSSRGYGFVSFESPLDAAKAILNTDGYQVSKDQVLSVSFAQKRGNLSSSDEDDQSQTDSTSNHQVSQQQSEYHKPYPTKYNKKFINALMNQNHPQQHVSRENYFMPLQYPNTNTKGVNSYNLINQNNPNWMMPMFPSFGFIPQVPPVPYMMPPQSSTTNHIPIMASGNNEDEEFSNGNYSMDY
ncbi:YGR250C [Saccharomyces arboricola H-6]|uniref:YGR250C n=1 Tax=Saccharomyces arboricola (strain H-6 / AS 2.3317 / CBS 10644) TaxID=1160507 RepID=J8Q1S5_SACAR|nr:YGR250C [Saccharomyces arboricola H-6]